MTLDKFINKLELLRNELGGSIEVVVEYNQGRMDISHYEEAVIDTEKVVPLTFGRYREDYGPNNIKVIKVY